MKIIDVWGFGDFGAMTFEDNFDESDYLGLWNKAMEEDNKKTTVEVGEYGEEIYIRAYEFGEIDEEFIDFVKGSVMDYDSMKHNNFYIVKER